MVTNEITEMLLAARARAQRGDYEGAQALEERVLAIRTRDLGEDHPETLASMSDVAMRLYNRGLHFRAMTRQRVILGKMTTLHGPDHLHTTIALNNLAMTCAALGRALRDEEGRKFLEEARTLQAQACEGIARTSGDRDPDTLLSRFNLATIYYDLGETDEALRMLEATLKTSALKLGWQHNVTKAIDRSVRKMRAGEDWR